jgi:hypothetical protein
VEKDKVYSDVLGNPLTKAHSSKMWEDSNNHLDHEWALDGIDMGEILRY